MRSSRDKRRWGAGAALALVMVLGINAPLASATTDLNDTADAGVNMHIIPTALPPAALDPVVLYHEDFETGTGGTVSPTPLHDYDGHLYTASDYWRDVGYCNGFITGANVNLSQDMINTTYCGQNGGWAPGDYVAVQVKAYALGLLAGSSNPETNRALSTNTSGGRPSTNINSPDSIMFRTSTEGDITLPQSAQGRFIAFSVDAANTFCGNPRPLMQFQYVQNDVTTPLPRGADGLIDPCSSPGSTSFDLSNTPYFSHVPEGHRNWVTQGAYGTFYSGSFLLDSAAPIGLILRNVSHASSEGCGIGMPECTLPGYERGSANGNDGAIDNIRIVDVTPVLDKEFDPAVQSVGRTSEMILTINNKTDLGEKRGWQFTDTLPEGLVFANGTVETTCGAGTNVTVDIDAGTLTVTDGLLTEGMASCTITATVASVGAETFTNGKDNGNFSNVLGIDGPPDADIEFYHGSVSWSKVDADNGVPLEGSEWLLEGPEPMTETAPDGGWPVGAVADCVGDAPQECAGLDKDPRLGEFHVSGLPSGTYTLTETRAPDGYEGAGPWSVEITADDPDPLFGDEGDGGKLRNVKILPAVMTVDKRLLDIDGAEIGPGEGWVVAAELSGAPIEGLTMTPEGSQETGADGAAPEPWQLTFPSTTSAADVRVSEVQRAGYEFASAVCVITRQSGDERVVSLTGIDGVLSGEDAAHPGDEIDCTFVNQRLPGTVTWHKVDEAGETLEGSEWVIIGPEPSTEEIPVLDCVGENQPSAEACAIDRDERPGFFEIADLHWGTYELVETRAPAGHYPVGNLDPFTIDGEHRSVDLGAIENPRIDGPEIPLTGGIGRDAFFGAGLGALVLGLGAALIQLRKRRRVVA